MSVSNDLSSDFRSNFPQAWKDTTTTLPPHPGQKPPPTGENPFTPTGGCDLNLRISTTYGGEKPINAQNLPYYEHMHPVLKECMKNYHKKHKGQVKMDPLLTAAGKRWKDLPKLAELSDTMGHNNICFQYLLGKCGYHWTWSFAKKGGHVEPEELPAGFLERVCAVIKTGADWLATNDAPTRPQPNNRKRAAPDS